MWEELLLIILNTNIFLLSIESCTEVARNLLWCVCVLVGIVSRTLRMLGEQSTTGLCLQHLRLYTICAFGALRSGFCILGSSCWWDYATREHLLFKYSPQPRVSSQENFKLTSEKHININLLFSYNTQVLHHSRLGEATLFWGST